ncbi:MAG: hypothetical protein EPN79_11315 [Burkholderiaceae bacterium]|nr:MAG: hypothetical protein EPN79_11315 [Burkholderiaceae bacterium]TBR76727.1 MAG: hypothetical protein EPN64_05755 [Burkholderiaceae bacterium]
MSSRPFLQNASESASSATSPLPTLNPSANGGKDKAGINSSQTRTDQAMDHGGALVHFPDTVPPGIELISQEDIDAFFKALEASKTKRAL